MNPKKALITGITGQDGSYLAELLLLKGYEVHGLMRRVSSFNTGRIEHLYQDPHTTKKIFLHYADLTDSTSLNRVLHDIRPDELYNLAAQSHVRISFDIPEYTANTDALGTIRLLEAVRSLKKDVKFYQASSSEMFGATPPPQDEQSSFNPRSIYGASKVFSYHIIKMYRDAYGMFACNGILFNHESPRRGENFVTRKITLGIAKIKAGITDKLYLGNLDAVRDWGYAPEYVDAMYRIMHHTEPEDFVIATGEAHSVKEFLEETFNYAGLDDWKKYVEFDARYIRPTEVNALIGNASKAKEQLGWTATTKFSHLVHLMVDADLLKYGIKEHSTQIIDS